MAAALKPVREQTIVIVGASSGIGLATAREAVKHGARVVIASRNGPALEEIAQALEQMGGNVRCVSADVGSREQVEQIARHAIEQFGGFDTWVNVAGVGIWGRAEDVPEDDARRLFDTNFWGVVHGSQVAASHLKDHGGAIVTVGSIASDRALPMQSHYSASKHAVKGFVDAFRMELEAEKAPISMTLVKPASIGTPLVQQARNYMDKDPMVPSPLYAPEEVATAILHAAETPTRDIIVGSAGRILVWLGRQAPRLSDWLGEYALIPWQKRRVLSTNRQSNLHAASPSAGLVRFDPENRPMRPSYSTRIALHPATLPALSVMAGLATAWALRAAIGIDRPRRTRWQRLQRALGR